MDLIGFLGFLEFCYTLWITSTSHTHLIIGTMLAIISYLREANPYFLCFTRWTFLSWGFVGQPICSARQTRIFLYTLLGGPFISHDTQGKSLRSLARSTGFLLSSKVLTPSLRCPHPSRYWIPPRGGPLPSSPPRDLTSYLPYWLEEVTPIVLHDSKPICMASFSS